MRSRCRQRAGDVQIHHIVVGAAVLFLHPLQRILEHGHLGHGVAAQLLAAGQEGDLRVLGSHQIGQMLAVGVQADVHLHLRVGLGKQLGGRKGIVDQRLFAEGLEVFVLEALAAGTAADGDEKFHRGVLLSDFFLLFFF